MVKIHFTNSNTNLDEIRQIAKEEEKEDVDSKLKRKLKRETCYETIDYTLSAFVFGPLAILYWSSTWDFFYYYVYSADRLKSPLVVLACGMGLHLILYLCQDLFQKLHDTNCMPGGNACYSKGFILRSVYAYVVSVAYLAQWYGYWDLYGYFIDQIPLLYGFLIAVIGIILNWALLKRSLYSFATTAPYYLSPDLVTDNFFLKDNYVKFERARSIEIILNYLYNEVVETIICIIIYKGVWQFYDVFYELSFYSELIVLFVNYLIYIVINALQKKLMKKYLVWYYSKNKCCRMNRGKILLNVISIFAFFSLIGIWGSLWRLYDEIATEKEFQFYILLGTHFACAILLAFFNTTTALYGFGGSSSDTDFMENNPDELYQNHSFFKIKYLTSFLIRN